MEGQNAIIQNEIVVIVIIIVNQLTNLSSVFPSIGLMLRTIQRSLKDIITFLIFGLPAFIGFVAFSNFTFGIRSEQFNTIGNSFVTLFGFMIKQPEMELMKYTNDVVPGVFMVLFWIVFNMVFV